MSREQEAGRELDALVAEKVMGLPPSAWPPPCIRHHRTDDAEWDSGSQEAGGWCYTCNTMISSVDREPPAYSTDISAAWEVVEKLKERHGVKVMGGPDDEGGCEIWCCDITAYGYRPFQDHSWSDAAATAPLAICRAALQATGASEPEGETR